MAKQYDALNKQKDKYEGIIKEKDAQILDLSSKVERLEKDLADLRKRLYDAGEGKGEVHRVQKQLRSAERDKRELENKLKDIDGSKLIATFSPERQELIRRIKAISFPKNGIFDRLAFKFKDGLDNVIKIAYKIKNNMVADMDYFTFVFRDDIVGLLEKMLCITTGKSEPSATNYLVKLSNGVYELPNDYYKRNPKLKDKTVLQNILHLLNLESTGYHGTKTKQKRMKKDKETGLAKKPDNFLNLDNEAQLDAIFTMLEFMYDFFTNKDNELNLLTLSSSWFKTI